MRRLRRWGRLRDSSGATAVEFALVSPALILAIVGGIQVAWTLHCASTVRWALESSARGLMMDHSESAATLKSAMLAQLSGKASASNLSVTITQDNSNAAAPMLVATSSYQATLSIPFLADKALTFTSTTKVPNI